MPYPNGVDVFQKYDRRRAQAQPVGKRTQVTVLDQALQGQLIAMRRGRVDSDFDQRYPDEAFGRADDNPALVRRDPFGEDGHGRPSQYLNHKREQHTAQAKALSGA